VRIAVGAVETVPDRECVAIADGRAVVVRVGDRVCAYRNRCLHQDSPLEGGWVRDGVLTCPLHFWRYRVDDGSLLDSSERLESFPVEVVAGVAVVDLPDPPPSRSLRDELLDRARTYDREREFERRRRHWP
jgi:nitrite reductase (NADH) small subunit